MKVLASVLCMECPQEGVKQGLVDVMKELDDSSRVVFRDLHGRDSGWLDAVKVEHPDWIWLQVQDSSFIDPSQIKAARDSGIIVSHWMGDLRYRPSAYIAEVCRSVSHTFASSIGHLHQYQEPGMAPASYLQTAIDPSEERMDDFPPPFRVPDVVFCGNWCPQFHGSTQRLSAIDTLRSAGIDIGVVGSGWPISTIGKCNVKEQQSIYRRASVALSISNENDVERYWSDRFLIAMSSATPVLARYAPGMEMEFTDGSDCLFYRTDAELLEKTRFLLDNREAGSRIGLTGRSTVMMEHTWRNRIRTAIEVLGIGKEQA